MKKSFQPGGKCGNCHWFKRSVKENNIVTEPCGCRKDNDPENCPPEDFMPRSKRKAKRPQKSWKLENRRSRNAEKRFEKR